MSLIDAAAEPILQNYLAQMKSIIRHDSSARERLRALIGLLLHMERHDGPLLDAYIGYLRTQRKYVCKTFLDIARSDLKSFFDECAKCGYLRPLNAMMMVTVLWGTCKTVAQTSDLGTITSVSTADVEGQKAELIMDLLVTGLGSSDDHQPTTVTP